MLTVTEPAGARLAQLLKAKTEDAVARIVCRKRRMRLLVDRLRTDDRTFAVDGRVVLVLDRPMSEALTSHKLDLRESDTGPRLSLSSQERSGGR